MIPIMTTGVAKPQPYTRHIAPPPLRGPTPSRNIVDKLAAGVDRRGADECWPWKYATTKDGYGRMHWSGYSLRADILTLVLETGEEPPGAWPFHTCFEPACCNPAHLRWEREAIRTRRSRNIVDKLVAGTDQRGPDECWPWTKETDQGGYGFIVCQKAGEKKVVRAHVLALILETGEEPPGLFSLHSCDNPPCVNPKHLRWGTAKDNVWDCIERGRRRDLRGEQQSGARLTEADVIDIRRRVKAGEPRRQLAEAYGMSPITIREIMSRKRWKHVA